MSSIKCVMHKKLSLNSSLHCECKLKLVCPTLHSFNTTPLGLSHNHHHTMDASVPTVPRLKQSFIAAQTNLLSQPLAPSNAWTQANDASGNSIPKRVVSDVLFIVNQVVQQHCRRVYPPQASYNVAEQISNAYTRDANARIATVKEEERVVTGLEGNTNNPLLGLDLCACPLEQNDAVLCCANCRSFS